MTEPSRLETAVDALQLAVNSLQTTLITMEHAVTSNASSTRDLNESVKGLRTEMAQTYVRKDVLEPTLETLKANVKEHDDWITWVTRIVLALVLVAVVGGVIVTGK